MMQESSVALAMDWGGTWCRIAVVSRDGRILWQSRARNAAGAEKEKLLDGALDLIQQARDWCGSGRPITGLGVAAAGPVDSDTGTLREPPNLAALDGVSLKSDWEAQLDFPVQVGNDANLAALGEFAYGAGLEARQFRPEANSLVYITVSTGIGGGVIDRGKLLLGARGLAGEVGHMVIDMRPEAPVCQCGLRGCLEALASGTAIAKIAREKSAEPEQKDCVLGKLEPGLITAERVLDAAGEGDSLAWSILDNVIESLSVGMINLLHLYNPDVMVMGGGVTFGLVRMGLLPRIYGQLQQRAMTDGHRNFHLIPSRLGDAPGMLGAASLVWNGG
jgi:glucokinase